MKKRILILSLLSACGSVSAADFTDTARVISSSPIYERVNDSRRECTMETVQVPAQERSMGGAVVGGLAGGLLGSQVGGGRGSTAAAGAGAVAGAVIGDNVSNPDSNRSATGGIVGGIAGALLGSQVGGGTGNKAATVVGGVAGAVVGDRVANPSQARTEQVQRCRDVPSSREAIKGYNVTYRYNNQDINTTLPYQPGSTVRVGVSVVQDQAAPERRYDDQQGRRYDESQGRRYDSPRYDDRRN